MQRRDFLRNSALASTTLFAPQFLQSRSLPAPKAGKKLVVVQLSGGNDGLNTVVPFRNDIYYKNRPTLGIAKKNVLKLGDDLGLNPAMTGLRSLYDEGLVSIINSVGYPNPDRSHFRSMDIWQTASGSEEYLTTGWLGRYLDNACNGCSNHQAVEVDAGLSLAMKGAQRNGFAMSDAKTLKQIKDDRFLQKATAQTPSDNGNLSYLYKTLISTQDSAGYLYEQSKVHRSQVSYPATAFAKDLQQIAELITADTATQVYYVSLGGFDTHVRQEGKQAKLLQEYSDGIQAFAKDLQQNNLLKDTLIMTFSEFGRRVQQNASGGTDHGTANNVFMIGGDLQRPGFYNQAPQLTDLDEGDLKYEIDFRQIYATVLDKWLEADSRLVLGEQFATLNI